MWFTTPLSHLEQEFWTRSTILNRALFLQSADLTLGKFKWCPSVLGHPSLQLLMGLDIALHQSGTQSHHHISGCKQVPYVLSHERPLSGTGSQSQMLHILHCSSVVFGVLKKSKLQWICSVHISSEEQELKEWKDSSASSCPWIAMSNFMICTWQGALKLNDHYDPSQLRLFYDSMICVISYSIFHKTAIMFLF